MIKKPELSIIPLGGRGEIGNNMMLIEYNNEILILDCGIMFPTEDMLGIDLVMPDISYLIKNKDRIKAMLISHGHEDHIGAIPYFLREISNIPIYGTKLTIGMIKKKLEENRLLKEAKLREISAGEEISLNPFQIKFVKVNHSIPDAVAMGIKTPSGTIVYTGDFKFDQTPINEEPTDFNGLTKLGEEGVLALLSDSTNAEHKGYSISERVVEENINGIFEKAKGRIIVATFSSHLDRLQQIINAAYKTGRKIAISGRSMIANTKIAKELGYLNFPDDMLVEIRKANNLSDHKIVYMMTGSQGETMASLTRIARGDHRQINLHKGDTVLLSATPIPGNERSVGETINKLFEKGAKVIYGRELDVHVSGHAYQEELKMMINMIKPKYFVPVHGEYRHLYHHSILAQEVGIPEENIFIAKNGSRLNVSEDKAYFASSISTGKVLIDGTGIGDVGNIVLRDRRILSEHGIIIVVVTIESKTGRVLAGPDIISRGFVYMKESQELIEEAKSRLTKALDECQEKNITDWSTLKTKIKDPLRDFIYNETRRNPMIMPIIMEVPNK
ncbi:ribonuclease J [Orenia marismortui]|uniref:Ribonuclease J n=1 Tax=Orenia marismortui TaxID=46469 RepID=A0A4R8GY13_9FIRM|nr:ribonuclease J [Orenia marismortui]TDX51275.1 ribonuclease J [Orenia marismortui]